MSISAKKQVFLPPIKVSKPVKIPSINRNPVELTDKRIRLMRGDCLNMMKRLSDNSVDAIVTDPPYGLEFMGKKWDKLDKGSLSKGTAMQQWHLVWATEALRVLKPGGHLLAFGGTRTYHRLATAIEDAGFEIRDQIQWLYGQGFPKSQNIAKALDKAGGVNPQKQAELLYLKRKAKGWNRKTLANKIGCTIASIRDWEDGRARTKDGPVEYMIPSSEYRIKLAEILGYSKNELKIVGLTSDRRGDGSIYAIGHSGTVTKEGTTTLAQQWEGWGTALKPANEPICVARKPLNGTVVNNVLQYGTGGLNIDACRIGSDILTTHSRGKNEAFPKRPGEKTVKESGRKIDQRLKLAHSERSGRWPSNVIHDGSDEVLEQFDKAGIRTSGSGAIRTKEGTFGSGDSKHGGLGKSGDKQVCYGDTGSVSRFFYCAKTSRQDRNEGLETTKTSSNHHPTVKPTELMKYLCRLVTPPNGVVLDPFMGSGSTGKASVQEGFKFIGIEREQDYFAIAKQRIKSAQESLTTVKSNKISENRQRSTAIINPKTKSLF